MCIRDRLSRRSRFWHPASCDSLIECLEELKYGKNINSNLLIMIQNICSNQYGMSNGIPWIEIEADADECHFLVLSGCPLLIASLNLRRWNENSWKIPRALSPVDLDLIQNYPIWNKVHLRAEPKVQVSKQMANEQQLTNGQHEVLLDTFFDSIVVWIRNV